MGARGFVGGRNHYDRCAFEGQRRVAAATQNQALVALFFLYKEVLAEMLPWLEHAKRPARRPTVLTVSGYGASCRNCAANRG